ncbi:hypothetical protein T492DRAFT_231440 [Pavlovales sp. CCMP2436]|nr:hypothetical protein T492DRAFT_231440 [Pavlovales sp. CCMP2436]
MPASSISFASSSSSFFARLRGLAAPADGIGGGKRALGDSDGKRAGLPSARDEAGEADRRRAAAVRIGAAFRRGPIARRVAARAAFSAWAELSLACEAVLAQLQLAGRARQRGAFRRWAQASGQASFGLRPVPPLQPLPPRGPGQPLSGQARRRPASARGASARALLQRSSTDFGVGGEEQLRRRAPLLAHSLQAPGSHLSRQETPQSLSSVPQAQRRRRASTGVLLEPLPPPAERKSEQACLPSCTVQESGGLAQESDSIAQESKESVSIARESESRGRMGAELTVPRRRQPWFSLRRDPGRDPPRRCFRQNKLRRCLQCCFRLRPHLRLRLSRILRLLRLGGLELLRRDEGREGGQGRGWEPAVELPAGPASLPVAHTASLPVSVTVTVYTPSLRIHSVRTPSVRTPIVRTPSVCTSSVCI